MVVRVNLLVLLLLIVVGIPVALFVVDMIWVTGKVFVMMISDLVNHRHPSWTDEVETKSTGLNGHEDLAWPSGAAPGPTRGHGDAIRARQDAQQGAVLTRIRVYHRPTGPTS